MRFEALYQLRQRRELTIAGAVEMPRRPRRIVDVMSWCLRPPAVDRLTAGHMPMVNDSRSGSAAAAGHS